MTVLDDLDRLWREVRADPYRYEDCVGQALALSPVLTDGFARILLTSPRSPSDQLALDVANAERHLRHEARQVARARPGQWVHHLDGDAPVRFVPTNVEYPSENARGDHGG